MNYYDSYQTAAWPKWPYPIEYGDETEVSCDVLVIGGGLAGCFTAIHAARRGAAVAVMEKGATVRSGAAGAGIDHWMYAATNPCCQVPPDEMIKIFEKLDPFEAKHVLYIAMQESYEALLDLEEMGVKVRDTAGDFAGAPFRDEKTGLLFAYDYDARYCIRIFGANIKPALYKEMNRQGVRIFDRTMGTMLLTEDGRPGNRVVGATGVNVRTGRFCVFSAKATVLATAKPLRLWEFGTDRVGSNSAHDDPNCAGDGEVMAWRAGARLMMMERSEKSSGALRYPAYGTGNATNTWYPCNVVDATGKTIPWVDRDGKIVADVDGRCRRAAGQAMFLPQRAPLRDYTGYSFPADLPRRIMAGEYKLPFYADLPSLPWYERYGIFGLMVGNEGKTRTPVYKKLIDSGFDPDKDMLQANVVPPAAAGAHLPWWKARENGPDIRETSFFNYGGLAVDWRLQTSLAGLFAAGNQVAGAEGAASAAACGRYCGRNAARFVKDKPVVPPTRSQIDAEKARIYSPLKNETGYGWKEIQIGLCRVMQDYVGEYKSKEVLEMGLWWLDSIRENELSQVCVRNPHELSRGLECDVRLTVGEIIIYHCLSRTSNSAALGFQRLDDSGRSEDFFTSMSLVHGQPKSRPVSLKYWLEGANAPSYAENYWNNCCRKEDKVVEK